MKHLWVPYTDKLIIRAFISSLQVLLFDLQEIQLKSGETHVLLVLSEWLHGHIEKVREEDKSSIG